MPKIKVNNINLYYEMYGQGQPWIFISGFVSNHTVWHGMAKKFAAQYQTIILDNRGTGQSDCPDDPYTIETMADDVAALCKELHLAPAHFLGSSMGSCIVQTIAHKYPNLVRSAILSVSFPKAHQRAELFARTMVELLRINAPQSISNNFANAFMYSLNYLERSNVTKQALQSEVVELYPTTLCGYEKHLHALLSFDSRAWFKDISKPCLVIAGEDDLLADATIAKQMATTIPNAQYFCFPKTGHLPQVEQPEILAQVLREFMQNLK